MIRIIVSSIQYVRAGNALDEKRYVDAYRHISSALMGMGAFYNRPSQYFILLRFLICALRAEKSERFFEISQLCNNQISKNTNLSNDEKNYLIYFIHILEQELKNQGEFLTPAFSIKNVRRSILASYPINNLDLQLVAN